MKPTSVNGKYYGVAINGTWNCEDTAYLTYYHTDVLKQCGLTMTPYQLYKQGKWNWEKQDQYARQVYKMGKGTYSGMAIQYNDLIMASAGVDFVKYDGKKYTNALGKLSGSSMITKAWKQVCEWNQDGILAGWDLAGLQQGKTGLFVSIAYGLWKEGGWFTNVAGGINKLEAVPMAGPKGGTAYTPVSPKVWGVAKRAKNAEGAAYFLRYFLDPSNCNMSATFYNKQFETVFGIITSKSTKKNVMYGKGILDYINEGTYWNFITALAKSTPANVTTELNSRKSSIEVPMARANRDLKG